MRKHSIKLPRKHTQWVLMYVHYPLIELVLWVMN